jgi:hypothetical protein
MFSMKMIAILVFSATAPLTYFAEPSQDSKMRKCAEVCAACQVECDSCFEHCLNMLAEGKKEYHPVAKLCIDCAECCKACAAICARNGQLAKPMLDCCAKCCDECAAACEKFPNDQHLVACAKACRDCAKQCREMLEQIK